MNAHHVHAVLLEVAAERGRQESKWGEQNHPNSPAGVKDICEFFGLMDSDNARLQCDLAFQEGRGTYAHILVEEHAEAIDAADDPVRLRAELIQVAAVAVAWIEKIDRDSSAHASGSDAPEVG